MIWVLAPFVSPGETVTANRPQPEAAPPPPEQVIVLLPYGNFPDDASFGDKVRMCDQPYLPISAHANVMLISYEVDVFTDGDRLYTFGDSGIGKALMPIQEMYRSKIKPVHFQRQAQQS